LTESRQWYYLAIVLVTAYLLYLVAPVLSPFLVALTLAYMGDPVADKLETRMPRGLSVTVVFLCLFVIVGLLLLVLIPTIERQLVKFFQRVPVYIDRIDAVVLPWIKTTFEVENLGINLDLLKSSIQQHWAQAGNIVAKSLATITQSGLALVGWMANLILIPVLTFYLLRDWDLLVARIHELLPRHIEPTVAQLARESDEVLGAFLRGQLSVMISLGAIYSIGLGIVGMDFWLLIGNVTHRTCRVCQL
jgi:predicted PurR-regulated permease PerM